MTETLSDIFRRCAALTEGDALPDSDAEAIYQAFMTRPYFVAAGILLLDHWPESWPEERLTDVRHAVALASSARRTLWRAAHGSEWSNFYPATGTDVPSTVDVIDTFLNTYGTTSPEEEAQLERLIFNPTPDYAELLARQEQEELPDEADDGDPDSNEARINAFIRSRHPARHATEASSKPEEETAPEQEVKKEPIRHPERTDDSLLSESLAKIFIKQGRYERAYEIISGLYLKFPKKSAYFADQLRFLQKLIINQRCLAARRGDDAAEKQS